MLKPGAALPMRPVAVMRHWLILAGVARVTLGSQRLELRAGESHADAGGDGHRIENCGTSALDLIEVQFGEDAAELDDAWH